MHMLRLSLIGNLGVDPEVGATQKGAPIATLRVAVNQQRTDTTTGERHEQTEWFRVRAMGRLVEPAQRLGKGGRVLPGLRSVSSECSAATSSAKNRMVV